LYGRGSSLSGRLQSLDKKFARATDVIDKLALCALSIPVAAGTNESLVIFHPFLSTCGKLSVYRPVALEWTV
jgi:hypothetical protein